MEKGVRLFLFSQRGRGSVAVKDDRLIRKRVDLLEMGQHLAITVIDKAQAAFHQRITREQVRTARHKQADRTIGMPGIWMTLRQIHQKRVGCCRRNDDLLETLQLSQTHTSVPTSDS